ncbi:dirigent protein 4-like [Bidens hawaiensis]|uniref:dirigent protein 4-like n=1 Tax=Bidens hawaiensis TaxID=980011 RepID=UPI00404959D2
MICIVLIIFALLLVILTATSPVTKGKYYKGSKIVDLPTTVKETHLRFFMHDILSGDNPSAVLVTKLNNLKFKDNDEHIPFGSIHIFDDPLTERLDPNSKVIGNGRGLYASVGRGTEVTLYLSSDVEFSSGEFNGSSISVACRDQITLEKELAIVGGRGKFRMAQGFVWVKVGFFNASTGDAVLEWRATVYHQ